MTAGQRGWGLLVAALVLGTPRFADARCQAQSVELPVRMVGSRAVATVEIDGTTVPMTVDSGAFYSMLTDAAAGQLHVRRNYDRTVRVNGVAGSIRAGTAIVDKLVLMKGEIDRVEFVVGGNEPGAGTMGLIGRNILAASDTEYDLANGAIRFFYPNADCSELGMAYWAGKEPVGELDLLKDGDATLRPIRAHVKLNGQEFTALFDTGATSVISAKAARRAGIDEATWIPTRDTYGIGREHVKQWIAPLARFDGGGEAVVDGRIRIADFDLHEADLLLGIDFFLSHRIYVSKQQSRIYLTYVGGPVFALDRVTRAAAAVNANGAAPAASAAESGIDEEGAVTADRLARRASASAARRDLDGALADLDRACALDPTSAALRVQRAGVLLAQKQPEKALADYDRALELEPMQADARFQRAALRLRRQDRAGAATDLDALDGTIAAQSQMRLAMANLYLTLDRPEKAIPQLDQWLAAHPKEINRESALNTRCWARVLVGVDLDRALDDCDEAVDADPKNASFRDSRAWVYLRQGKDRKALDEFDRSLQIQPKSAFSLYGRGLAKAKLGTTTDGDADLDAARALRPDIERRLARTGLAARSAVNR